MLPVKYSVMTLEINSWWQILWADSKLLSPTQDLAFHSRLPAQQLASRKISETWDSGYKKVIIVLWCFKKAKHNTLMETAQPARNMLVPVTINSSSNCFYCYFISLGIVSTMLSVAFGKKNYLRLSATKRQTFSGCYFDGRGCTKGFHCRHVTAVGRIQKLLASMNRL